MTTNDREQVPARYRADPITAAILAITTQAALRAGTAMEDVEAQLWPDTATWGLELWEEKLGLRSTPDMTQEARRAAVRRSLTAAGTTTEAMIAEIGRTYTGFNCRVEVTPDYTIHLSLTGETSSAVNLDLTELYRVVEEIKPAHLKFETDQLTWAALEAMGLTWAYFDATPTTWAELENWTPVNEGGIV